MIEARDNAMATLLADGRVLVAGGFQKACTPNPPCTDSIDPLASAELYDPGSGS
jgi:hypothetical protein